MDNNFYRTKRALTEDDLKQFETMFNVCMPEKIKNHYLKFNGGYPEKTVFFSKESNEKYIVNYFFSIGVNEGMTIEKTYPLLRDRRIFPMWLVPFADEDGGNLFAYSLRKGEEGAIYYYDHEFEFGENPEDHVVYLSKDIDDFLNSLEFEDEEL